MVEYCRRCGNPADRLIPEGDSLPRATCGGCGAIEYDNPKVVVACPLYEGDRILWVKRTFEPYAGCWALPAGFLELGETLAEAACREVLEETRLQISPEDLTLYGVLSLPDVEQIYVALAGRLPNHDYGSTAEASEVRMISRDEISSVALGYPEATLRLVLDLYDSIARGELEHPSNRLFEIRGRDPGAFIRM